MRIILSFSGFIDILSPVFVNGSNSTAKPINVSISLPPEVFNISTNGESDPGLIFTSYRDPVLFQVSPPEGVDPANYSFVADSVVLGFAVAKEKIKELTDPVKITLQSLRFLQNNMVMPYSICKYSMYKSIMVIRYRTCQYWYCEYV